jgi:hypothetical protein
VNDKPNLRAVMQLLQPSLPVNDDGRTNPMCAALILASMQASLDPATIASSVIDHSREHGNLIGLLPSLQELMRNPPTLNLPDWFETDFGGWSDGNDCP